MNLGKVIDKFEDTIRENMPNILDILLIDHTTSTANKVKNIIWANNNYINYGSKFYAPTAQVKRELVTGYMSHIIWPRSLKSKEIQKERTKLKAEVFTPTWIVKKQNDEIDKEYQNDLIEKYVKRKWIEIACGEAPYMASRYDMETGEKINLSDRIGFVDRKLQRINNEIEDKENWQKFVVDAYKSSYGFEWSGDSLLLARENLLYTYRDYYFDKWSEVPSYVHLEKIAEIISYNIFQMDGLNLSIPLTERKEKKREISLFDNAKSEVEWIEIPGKRVKIMNWETNKMEFFNEGIK